MFIIESVGKRDIYVIPTLVSRFVATVQQNGHPAGIKGIRNPVRSASMLVRNSLIWSCFEPLIPEL